MGWGGAPIAKNDAMGREGQPLDSSLAMKTTNHTMMMNSRIGPTSTQYNKDKDDDGFDWDAMEQDNTEQK